MARMLSTVARKSIAYLTIAFLTITCARTGAEQPQQRYRAASGATSSIKIKPIAPAPQKAAPTSAPSTTRTRTKPTAAAPATTSKGPQFTRPSTPGYRNPFSTGSAADPGDVTLLFGPRGRWSKNKSSQKPAVTATAAPQIITPPPVAASIKSTPPQTVSSEPKPARSTLQLIVPKQVEMKPAEPVAEAPVKPAPANPVVASPKESAPLHVASVEEPKQPPSVLAPPVPRHPEPVHPEPLVKTAILTAEPKEPAAFDWNAPPVLKSLPESPKQEIAITHPEEGNRYSEPATLVLPDPARFTSQPKEPVWLETAAPQKQAESPVDQAAFEATLDSKPADLEPAPQIALRAPENAAAAVPQIISTASNTPVNEPVETHENMLAEESGGEADEEPLIISDYSDSPEGWLAEAKEAVRSKHTIEDLSRVITLCQRVTSTEPRSKLGVSARRLAAWAYNRRGELLIDSGRSAEALNEFQKAVTLDEFNSLAIHNRAVTLAQGSDFDGALADFNRVIELNPGLAIAYHNRAELLAAQGKMDEAIDDYTRAIETITDDPQLYRGRAYALQQLSRFDQALSDLDQAIRIAPADAQSFTQRGNLLADRGHYERALEDLEQSLAIDPKLAETHRAIAWIKATCPEERYRDAYQALGAAKEAVKLSPQDDYLALDALAAAHANAGEFDRATEIQRQAVSTAPHDAVELMQSRLSGYEQRLPYRSQPLGN